MTKKRSIQISPDCSGILFVERSGTKRFSGKRDGFIYNALSLRFKKILFKLTIQRKLKSIFEYVRDDIKFQFPVEGDLIPASKIIENGYGQCNNKSTLFLALCKAAGFSARIHFSLISKEIQKGFFKGISYRLIPDEISHSWVEVYIDGKWMKIDGYINDKTLHYASLQKLSELDWEVGFSVANKNHAANPELNFENENFVQMAAVTESHGVYDDPTEYYQTPLYKNRPSKWKIFLYRQIIAKVNKRVKKLRANYLNSNLKNELKEDKNNIMKNILYKAALFCMVLLLTWSIANAQDDARILLESLEEEDIKNIDALAMYPEDTRMAILELCLHPEVLIKIKKLQYKTSQDFVDVMDEYPKETQEAIWDLTRYPNLIKQLVNEGKPSASYINKILTDYPEAVHKRVNSSVENHFEVLKKVNKLNEINQTAYQNVVASYDENTRNALQQLVGLPEVMSVLTDNIEVVILVGDAYKNYPDWVLHKADSLHLELARQNAQELEDWKKRVEENPELAEDLEATAKEFATENNYDDLYYDNNNMNTDNDMYFYDDAEEEAQNIIVERHYHYHYPFWYGYPSWYDSPRWRPYPYWYDWGFYFRPNRPIVIVHLPSFFFVDWYFYHPHHHHYHPYLSAHFVHHHHRHNRSVSSISTSVRSWRGKNNAFITDEMVVNAPRKIEAFREFGRMEEARVRHNQLNPKEPLTQVRFVEENKNKYPTLREVRQIKAPVQTPAKTPIIKQQGEIKPKASTPKSKPRVLFPPRTEKETPKQKEATPKTKPRVFFPPRIEKETPKQKDIKPKPKPNFSPKAEKEKNRITTRKATDVHQSIWGKSKTPKPRVGAKTKTIKTPKSKTSKQRKGGKND